MLRFHLQSQQAMLYREYVRFSSAQQFSYGLIKLRKKIDSFLKMNFTIRIRKKQTGVSLPGLCPPGSW